VHVVVGGAVADRDGPAGFAQILLLLSLVSFAAAWGWHGWSLAQIRRQAVATVLHRLTDQERGALQARLQVTLITCLALLETPAVFGLMNTFIGSPYPRLFEWLAGASLAGMLVLRVVGFPAVFELLDRLEPSPGGPAAR
jgi:hypothetical protein